MALQRTARGSGSRGHQRKHGRAHRCGQGQNANSRASPHLRCHAGPPIIVPAVVYASLGISVSRNGCDGPLACCQARLMQAGPARIAQEETNGSRTEGPTRHRHRRQQGHRPALRGYVRRRGGPCLDLRPQPAEVDETVAALRAKGVTAYGEAMDVADKAALEAWVGASGRGAGRDRHRRRQCLRARRGGQRGGLAQEFEIDMMHTVRAVNAAMPHLEKSRRRRRSSSSPASRAARSTSPARPMAPSRRR